MDQYIRDFKLNTLETYTLQNCEEAKTVLQVNNHINNFKILQKNIRSLNKNLDEFVIILHKLVVQLDCLILTETWKLDDPELYNINGYDMLYNQGDYNQNDGVVAYIKSNLKYSYEIIPLNNTKILQIKIHYKKGNHLIPLVIETDITDHYTTLLQLQKDPENAETKTQYKNYKNKLTTIIRKAKQKYYDAEINKNKKNMKTIYHSLVESHLNYAILAWGSAQKTHLEPLEILQKRFLKYMLRKKITYSTESVYRDSKIFDARQLYYYNSNIQFHIKKQPSLQSIHNYNTRKREQYKSPFMYKSIGQRSNIFLSPRLYNTVPENLRV
ncbi:hypothetical protein NQ317_007936 [Molorchus minor]|uniref:Uncharacterized protein n=1 Tax=Molorchus minor TaxID=1323400 RepID=A0ABQ9JRM7_9CUCU|nr:hypothetical protein NQ317_007936 [Molorchus minor]